MTLMVALKCMKNVYEVSMVQSSFAACPLYAVSYIFTRDPSPLSNCKAATMGSRLPLVVLYFFSDGLNTISFTFKRSNYFSVKNLFPSASV